MSLFVIDEVHLNQVEQLQSISRETFYETYCSMNTKENMDKYLNENLKEEEKFVEAIDWWRVILESTDNYSMRFFENKKVNLGMVEFRGVENGVSVTYTFELKGGEWFLVEMEDFSI